MLIGIIGAMRIEIDGLVSLMTDKAIEISHHMQFCRGNLFGREAVVVLCGAGKVNAAVATQMLISRYQPDMVINIGVAGGVSKKTKVWDIVVATGVVQHDMDTTGAGDPIGFISGINLVEIPCTTRLVEMLKSAAKTVNEPTISVHTGIIATGDQFICSNEGAKRISDTFSALACEMEGGSIGQVCYINDVDFCVVRSISDGGDDNANVDFHTFCVKAADMAIEMIGNFLKEIK